LNPRLAFEFWLAIGAAATVVAYVHAWAINGVEGVLRELRDYGALYISLAIALTVVCGPISMAWAVAYVLRKREERLEEQSEWEARRARLDRDFFERENASFERAVARMAECSHDRTVRVDYGGSTECYVDKCLECWAFRLPDGQWAANSTPPPTGRREAS
jgi:hypothetical protein